MLKRFACSYRREGRRYGLTITARSWDEAERIAAVTVAGAWVDGVVVSIGGVKQRERELVDG